MPLNTCAQQLVHRLAAADSWISRADLVRGLEWTEGRLDSELADLVLTGRALYNSRTREYRLPGTPLARKALQQLVQRRELQTLGLARPDPKDEGLMHVAIAIRRLDGSGDELLGTVELEVPCPGLDEKLRLMGVVQAALLADQQQQRGEQAHGGKHAGV